MLCVLCGIMSVIIVLNGVLYGPTVSCVFQGGGWKCGGLYHHPLPVSVLLCFDCTITSSYPIPEMGEILDHGGELSHILA